MFYAPDSVRGRSTEYQRNAGYYDDKGFGTILAAMVRRHGSAGHRYVSGEELNSNANAARNLADATHYPSMMHGYHPGVIYIAAAKPRVPRYTTGWPVPDRVLPANDCFFTG